ncbi:MAG: hypothetical protein PHQ73_01235 [Gallionella sp.]|nr:hypothetical protein [Gallionella sp.]
MKLIALLLACLVGSYAHAGWSDRQGNPLVDVEDRKANGNFGAQLIFTTDEQGLFNKWATPSEGVNIDNVDSVEIGKPISAFIIFCGCKPSTSGNCNVSMRFRVLQPDGKVYSETPNMEVWQDKPAPPRRSLELSIEYLKVIVESHEQRGRYIVQTQVRDDNTGAVIYLQKSFTAVDLQR